MAARNPTSSPGRSSSPALRSSPGPAPEVFCRLCLTEQPSAATRELQSCHCVFCTACLQWYVRLNIAEGGGAPITCPDMSCRESGALLDSEIAALASPEQAALHQRLKFEREVSLDPLRAWCPVLECQSVCSLPLSSEGGPVAVPCPSCRAVFCSGCRGPWADQHTCPEQQHMMQVTAESSSRGRSDSEAPIKQCPVCGVYIERNQGCAQMLCKSCKHTFCWYCLENLDGDIFLRHYDKGPCRNKLGHSRASVMWNRAQVVGILVGICLVVMVTSPLLVLASPCILCCVSKPCRGRTNGHKKKKRKDGSRSDPSSSSS